MYTGWRRNLKFDLNRPLTAEEKRDVLSRDAATDPSFDERGGLVALNSTYIEWIDRRFRARGAGSTFLTTVAALLFLGIAIAAVLFAMRFQQNKDLFLVILGVAAIGMFGFCLFWWLQVGIDFFNKVYWPIRFNRKNRMIYVYRDKRDGGILQVPWEKAYFHIGYGMLNPDFCDIRGEIMDGETVKDTFAVGNYYPDLHIEGVRQSWAFICRYMEGGPEAVGPDPCDRYIETSLHGNWRDCMGTMYTNYPPEVNVATMILGWPMILATTVTRWLVFKTCRMPKWPADIEAACKIDPSDPNIWPQPEYDSQFTFEKPGVAQRLHERREANERRAWDAAPKSDAAKGMADLESMWQQRDKQ